MNNLIVFDNDGETFDRYTILDKKTGEMIGASNYPFHPQGFGQYYGNVADNYWNIAFGCAWHRVDDKLKQKRIRFAVRNFLSDCTHIGKRVKFSQLPEDVKQFAKQSFL